MSKSPQSNLPMPGQNPSGVTSAPGHNLPGLPERITVAYRPFAESERWLKQRFSQSSAGKAGYAALAVVVFVAGMLCLGWLFAEAIVRALGAQSQLGASTYQSWKYLNQLIISLFSLTASVPLAVVTGSYLGRSTQLHLDKSGISLGSVHGGIKFASKRISWESCLSIGLQRRLSGSAVENFIVVNDKGGKQISIKVSALADVVERETVLAGLKQWGHQYVNDIGVFESLLPPREHVYTQLWLQALTAPPQRENLLPLVSDAVLGDGRYQVKRKLGLGGQGTAYLASDLKKNQDTVVLKEFILPVYVDIDVRKQALAAFENEARILKALDHPGVVKLLDFFAHDQRTYLVLEYIEGESLEDRVLKKGPMNATETKKLAWQMCDILEYLHRQSPPVVHRDFTPDNLILRPNGSLTLLDFNVAQQTDGTNTSTVVGKQAYLPPEQFRGQPVPASDVYAMGGTLFYVLTGRHPEALTTCHPFDHNPSVPVPVDTVIAKATALELSKRYGSAAEFRKDVTW